MTRSLWKCCVRFTLTLRVYWFVATTSNWLQNHASFFIYVLSSHTSLRVTVLSVFALPLLHISLLVKSAKYHVTKLSRNFFILNTMKDITKDTHKRKLLGKKKKKKKITQYILGKGINKIIKKSENNICNASNFIGRYAFIEYQICCSSY